MPILRLIGDDWPKESKINFSYDPNKPVKDYRANLMKLLSLRNIRDYTFWHVAADGESPDMERDPLNLDWKWSDYGFQPNMFVYLRKSQPGDRKCDPNAKPLPKSAPLSSSVDALSSAEAGAHSMHSANTSSNTSPLPTPTSGTATAGKSAEALATVPVSASATSTTVIHLIGDKWIKEQRKVLALKSHETIDRYIPTIGKKLEIDISVEGMRERAVGNWEMWPTIAPAGIKPDLEKGPFDPSSTWEAYGVGHKSCVYFRQRRQEDAISVGADAAAVPAFPSKVEETKASNKSLIATNEKEDSHDKSTANVQMLTASSAPTNSTIVSTVVSNPTKQASSPSTLVETPMANDNSESFGDVTNLSDTQQKVGAVTMLIKPSLPSSSASDHFGGNSLLTSETKVAPEEDQINSDQQTASATPRGAPHAIALHIVPEISASAPLLAEKPLPAYPLTSHVSTAQSQLQGGLPAQNIFSAAYVPRMPLNAYNTGRLDDAAEAEKQALREHILRLEARVVRMEAAERVQAEREAAIAAELGYPAAGSWRHPSSAPELYSNTLLKANSSSQRMIGGEIDRYSLTSSSPLCRPETGLAQTPSPTRASVPFVEDEHLRRDIEAQLEDLDLSTQRRRRHASTAIALYEMSRFRGARGQAADLPTGTTSRTYSYMH